MTQSNLKIAITGGIGSGKSTVSKFIKERGYSVISCDEIYDELLCDKSFLKTLSSEFGGILNSEGMLDRKKLSIIVFGDKAKLKRLNEITHPLIINKAIKMMSGEGIYFCEVPLLFEGGFQDLFDKVIIVLRDEQSRISAVAQRDKLSISEVKTRINNQFNYNNLQFEKYYVIRNESDLANLRIQTFKTIDEILSEI